MKVDIQELIIRSFDDQLTEEEQKVLNHSLQSDAEMIRFRKEMLAIRKTISDRKARRFSNGFTQNVLDRISGMGTAADDLANQLFHVFRPLAVAASLAILVILAYHFSLGGGGLENLFGIPEYNLENIAYAAIQ